MKVGTKVIASTIRGNSRPGSFVKTWHTAKGDWLEIKPDDGGKNYKTRPALVSVK